MSEIIKHVKDLWPEVHNALREKHPEYLQKYLTYYQQVVTWDAEDIPSHIIYIATEILRVATALGIDKPIPPKETLSFKIPHGLKEALVKKAEEEGVSQTEIVVKALRKYLGLE